MRLAPVLLLCLGLLAGAAHAQPLRLEPSAAAWTNAEVSRDSTGRGETAPRGRRLGPVVRNALVGGVLGGAFGYLLGRTICDACDDPAPVYGVAAIGAGIGATLGVVFAFTHDGARLRLEPSPAASRLRSNVSLQLTPPITHPGETPASFSDRSGLVPHRRAQSAAAELGR